MTEILVQSLDGEDTVVHPNLQSSSSSIQMQGFAASGTFEPVGEDRRARASSRVSMPVSFRSEPDLDTIMPLPGTRDRTGYQHLTGEGSDTESDTGEDGNVYSPIASFTTVEVRDDTRGPKYKSRVSRPPSWVSTCYSH